MVYVPPEFSSGPHSSLAGARSAPKWATNDGRTGNLMDIAIGSGVVRHRKTAADSLYIGNRSGLHYELGWIFPAL